MNSFVAVGVVVADWPLSELIRPQTLSQGTKNRSKAMMLKNISAEITKPYVRESSIDSEICPAH